MRPLCVWVVVCVGVCLPACDVAHGWISARSTSKKSIWHTAKKRSLLWFTVNCCTSLHTANPSISSVLRATLKLAVDPHLSSVFQWALNADSQNEQISIGKLFSLAANSRASIKQLVEPDCSVFIYFFLLKDCWYWCLAALLSAHSICCLSIWIIIVFNLTYRDFIVAINIWQIESWKGGPCLGSIGTNMHAYIYIYIYMNIWVILCCCCLLLSSCGACQLVSLHFIVVLFCSFNAFVKYLHVPFFYAPLLRLLLRYCPGRLSCCRRWQLSLLLPML